MAIFEACLDRPDYDKLLHFLAKEDPRIYDCPNCEEHVFVDVDDDGEGGTILNALQCVGCKRGFCVHCPHGPHPKMTCEERAEVVARERKSEADESSRKEALEAALVVSEAELF